MRWPVNIFLTGILLAAGFPAIPQAVDTSRHHRLSEVTWHTASDPLERTLKDTLLDEFHLYRLTEQNGRFFADLGAYGSALYPLVFQPRAHLASHPGFEQWNAFFRNPDEVKMYDPPFPFTHLYYVQGTQGDQVFRATHSENFRERVLLGGDYRVIQTPGIYTNQKSHVDDLALWAAWRPGKRRYQLQAGYVLGRARQEVNGGINDPDYYPVIPRANVPVNLRNAVSEYSRQRLWLQQSWSWGGGFPFRVNDTLEATAFYPRWTLFHRVTRSTYRCNYTDANPSVSFYPEILLRSDSTIDYTTFSGWVNRLGLQNSGIRSRTADSIRYTALKGGLYLEQTWYLINQQGREYYTQDYATGFSVSRNPQRPGPFNWQLAGQYTVAGTNAGAYDLETAVRYHHPKAGSFSAQFQAAASVPGFASEKYLSNHYWIDTAFRKIQWIKASLGYKLPVTGHGVQFNYYRVNHLVVYDTTGASWQTQVPAGVFQVLLSGHVQAGRFHLINHLAWQYTTSPDSIPLPRLLLRHSLFYETPMFSRAITARFGGTLHYRSSWYGPEYLPGLGQFAFQNEILSPGFLRLDLFFAFRLKTARIFFSADNITHGLISPHGNEPLPGYPVQDWAARIGVSWYLFY